MNYHSVCSCHGHINAVANKMNYHNVANNSISKILNSEGLETDNRQQTCLITWGRQSQKQGRGIKKIEQSV